MTPQWWVWSPAAMKQLTGVRFYPRWNGVNNSELNISKTKELAVDFCRSWTATNSQATIPSTLKRGEKPRLSCLRRLKECGRPIHGDATVQFYWAAVENILTDAITVWFGSGSAEDRRQLDKVVRTDSRIIGCGLPPLEEIHNYLTCHSQG